jgi:hypothetical protein
MAFNSTDNSQHFDHSFRTRMAANAGKTHHNNCRRVEKLVFAEVPKIQIAGKNNPAFSPGQIEDVSIVAAFHGLAD